MKATRLWAGTLLATALTASLASAQTYCSPVFKYPLPAAPDACGPGFYTVCPDGTVFGPNWCLRPPCGPFNGILPGPHVGQKMMSDQLGVPYMPPRAPYNLPTFGQPPQANAFPYHPYVRSPRDFFMWRENMDEQLRRDQRPALVP